MRRKRKKIRSSMLFVVLKLESSGRFRLNCLNEIISGSFKLLNSARESSHTMGEFRKMVLYLVSNQFTSGVPGNQMKRLQS